MFALSIANAGQAGSEFIVLGFWQLFRLLPITLPMTSVLLFAFPFIFRKNKILKVISLLMALGLAVVTVRYFVLAHKTTQVFKENERILSKAETILLLENCQVESIFRDNGAVNISYKENYDSEGNWDWKPASADPSGYDAYVDSIKGLSNKCGQITYLDNDRQPSSIYSWIRKEKATTLLNNCEIKTFGYSKTKGSNYETETAAALGEPTGILLTDHDWVKHIWVDITAESDMIPIARSAQKTCGGNVPQFFCGDYEQSSEIGKKCRTE